MKCLPLALGLTIALTACSQPSNPEERTATPGHATTAAAPAGDAVPATVSVKTDDLGKYHWLLSEAMDSGGKRIDALFARPDKPLQLDFTDQRINVSNACNRLGGGYTVEGEQLHVNPMAATMMACPDPALSALDGAISQRLQGSSKMSLQTSGHTPQLRLVTASNDTLVFNGEPTAETRYGSQGETVFLEVAADTKPCSHPLMPNAECLQVRERTYDAQGLATGTPGEWQPLYQNIEGYTHESGVRNVLRLKRYDVRNPPADAPNKAYVLDMVVESETVKK